MKNIIALISLFLMVLTGQAQDEETPKNDTTKIKLGKSTIIILKNSQDQEDYDYDLSECDTSKNDDEWVGISFSIGTNGYMAPDYELALPAEQSLMAINYPRSRSFGINVMSRGADIVKDRIYLTAGLGVSWNSYFFKNNVSITTSNDSTRFIDDSIEYNKYKLRLTYLEIPLILGARIGNLDHPIGLQIGVIGGFKIGSMLKRKYKLDETKYKDKIRDDFNINPFKLDAIVRISIDDIGLFARYSLTTLFEKNKAPELYAFSVGFTFGDFTGK